MNILKHLCITITAVFFILGIPFINTDWFKNMISDTPDAMSGSSLNVDKPSGNYIVFINLDKHSNKNNLKMWHDFFEGKDTSFIFEDIDCAVAKNDVNGLKMARSFQTRLPENQMNIKTEDAVLMLSKAEYGKFDIIILSQELAD